MTSPDMSKPYANPAPVPHTPGSGLWVLGSARTPTRTVPGAFNQVGGMAGELATQNRAEDGVGNP